MPASVSGEVSGGRRPYKDTCMPLPELFRGPRVDRLVYRVHDGIHAAVGALKRDEVDLVDFPVPEDVGDLGDGVAVDRCRDFGYYYVGFNTRRAPLDSKVFRNALAYLIDDVKKAVAGSLGSDRVELMDSIMVQYYGRLVNRYVPRYETDGADDALARALGLLNGAAGRVADGAVRFLVTTDDPIAKKIMGELRSRIEGSAELARVCSFVEASRNEIAEVVYSGDGGDWHVFCGWQYVQDNLSRWNPGMSKLRLSLDWTADFQSGNSRTRNYVGFSDPEFDRVAGRFLTALQPRDLRGAVITEDHLEPWWNNAGFWEKGGDLPQDANALLLLWKLQWMIADQTPIVPLFSRTVRFARAADVTGVWNGDPDEAFTYPGGSQPIESTYPGGTLSYWTFQRARKAGSAAGEIRLGLSNPLRHLNPLGVGNYWDALIWGRIYESMLGLNPFLLTKGVAEDAVNLADSFTSEFFTHGVIRYGLHFTVKPGVRWHDGTDFTAYDVAFSYLSMLGGRGREMAGQHPSTAELAGALVNDEPIPAWVDLARWLEHVEVADDKSVSLYFTQASRFLHEWFGDMPIIPMHVWRHLGPDFTRPAYRGSEGLYAICDEERGAPSGPYCGWHGLVGTGPFVWHRGEDPLRGGTLTRFTEYHNRIELEG
jgi:ABC-type transport system substrate-binding protein